MAKLKALACDENPAAVQTPFDPKLAAVQALNPSVGKGINRPKPDSTAASGLPNYFVDWFEEYLRYVGMHLCADSYKVGDHTKVIAMAPGWVSEAVITKLREEFVSLSLPWAAVRADVLASLGLALVLVSRSGLLDGEDSDSFGIQGWTPRDIVAGIQTAFFSNLGSAYALTNTSFIGLPGWFQVANRESAAAWNSILIEHRRVIRSLDEDKSEEASMLLRYRDFLSAGDRDLGALLDFWGMYACYVMRKGGKSPVPLFTIQNTERLLMNTAKEYGYGKIVQNEGFRAVATAIRLATVSEQFQKSRVDGKQEYEIHYGLFQELRQKARFKDQVVTRLSEFVASYNYENARKAEQAARSGRKEYRRRTQVTQQQLDQLIGLLDENPEVVVMLLVAYGSASARDAKDAAANAAQAAEAETLETVENQDHSSAE